MKRNAGSIFLLVSFVNYIMGCASTYNEKTSVEQAGVESAKIVQLVLKNGETIDFNENGGRFILRSEGIEGTISGGTLAFVSLAEVTGLRMSYAHSIPEAELDGASIAEVVLRSGHVITFDQLGGRYDKEQRIITGKRIGGETFSTSVERALSIRVEEPKTVSVDSFLLQDSKQPVYEALRDDGTVVLFDSAGGKFREGTGFFGGRDILSRNVYIQADEVLYANVEKVDAALTAVKTLGAVVAVGGVLFLIALATKESCPFLYSFDGERYVFDGEPYGGAVCEGLKRTDWARLDYLKPVEGEYRLLITNEVDETQFTDELKLWVIDHQPNAEVLLDVNGNAYTIARRVKLIEATDKSGKDLRNWFKEHDELFWQSDMSLLNPRNPSDLRDTIHLTFAKPREARNAKFIFGGGTTLWGSQMLKRMVQLRGEAIPLWYEEMKSPEARQMLDLWNLREELYHLLVRVRVGDEWVARGEILGGGPFVTEERVVPLDLRGVEGDSVEILLTPAAGFWQLNSFAVDYSASQPVQIQEIAATSIVGDEGEDLLSVLSATDGTYYPAPRNGQTAKVVFPVPLAKPDTRRTMFAKTSGYYEMRMNISGPPKTEAITRIAMEPGYPTAFAIEEFQKWKSEVEHAGNLQTRGAK